MIVPSVPKTACNCENASGSCDHGKGDALRPCARAAGLGRVEWLGPVCDHCCGVYAKEDRRYVLVDVNGQRPTW